MKRLFLLFKPLFYFRMSRSTNCYSPPCFHCYKANHSAVKKCTTNGMISCTKCFRLNVFTAKCNCEIRTRRLPLQVLRLVGKKIAPRMFVDLLLHDEIVPAMLNTSIETSQVNTEFANWWQSISTGSIYRDVNTILIETVRKGLRMSIQCNVIESQENWIELGTEFMMAAGFSITLEGVNINSDHSPVLSSPYILEYVYNLRHQGNDLRNYLNQKRYFLKQGRIRKPSFNLPESLNRTVIVRHRNHPKRSSN